MRLRALALVLLPSLAIGLGACGSSVPDTSNPAKKPELVAPESANGFASTTAQESSSSTASADAESSAGTTTQPQTQQQAPATQTPSTAGGGTAAPQTQTPDTNNGGGAAAPQGDGAQNFESFCKQNPGAC